MKKPKKKSALERFNKALRLAKQYNAFNPHATALASLLKADQPNYHNN